MADSEIWLFVWHAKHIYFKKIYKHSVSNDDD